MKCWNRELYSTAVGSMLPILSCISALIFISSAASGATASTPSLRPGQFPPTERRILQVSGDRLQKPGKEVLTLNATLDQFTNGLKVSSVPVTASLALSGTLQVVNTLTQQIISFTGVGSVGLLSQQDLDLVESVTKDSTENFLQEGFAGSPVQLIGHQYNIKDPRSSNKLTGQCDLFQVSEVGGVRGANSVVQKTFCFDPLTSLLKVVVYRDGQDLVETRFSGWQVVNGNSVPGTIQRFKNGAPVLVLTVGHSAFSAAH